MFSLGTVSPYDVKGGTEIFTANSEEKSNDSYLEPAKNMFVGLYKTLMGVWTFANIKFFSPGISTFEQRPRIQGMCEKVRFHLGTNVAHPDVISELYLPSSLIYRDKFTIPMTNFSFTVPLLKFPVETIHMLNDPNLNKRILKSHRNDEFSGGPTVYDAAFGLLQTIFSDDQFDREDFLLTSGSEYTRKAHRVIAKALNPKRLEEIITDESNKLIERWLKEGNNEIDLSKETQLFTASVITHAMFNDSNNSKELYEAVSFMNTYLYAKIIGTLVDGDTELFNEKCKVFRDVIDTILKSENVETLPLFNGGGFTLNEKRGLCLLMFFAGQETTAFALAHVLAELALNPEKQKFFIEALQKAQGKNCPELKIFVDNLLMKIPPANGVSRKVKEDSYISYECENGEKVKKYIKKDERLMANITGTSSKIQNEFAPKYSEASIFGDGVNRCIGQKLALMELYQFPIYLIQQFQLSTRETEFKYHTKATNQAKPFFVKAEKQTSNLVIWNDEI